MKLRSTEANTFDSLYSTTGEGILLFKLHGSVNWFEKKSGDEKQLIEVDDGVSQQGAGNTEHPEIINDRIAFDGECSEVIVPPSFLKPEIEGVMSEQWKGAAKALNTASVITFVGYSFPPTDVEMKYFFARSLGDNKELRQINIIDPNANSIVARLSSADSGFGSHFKQFLNPVEKKWEETNMMGEEPQQWLSH